MGHNIILTKNKSTWDKNNVIIPIKELNHYDSIHKKFGLSPESNNNVKAEFIFQSEKLIRYYIKELDRLLKVGGIFEIVLVDSHMHGGYFRSNDQTKYEFSIATNGRYSLINSEKYDGILILKYRKNVATLIQYDSINKWSFGINTNGQKNSWVLELIESIKKQNIPEYEIIVCGPSPYSKIKSSEDNFVHILDDVIINDSRAPICHKKNIIIKSAKYNNLCIMHDRFILPENWYSNMKSYGNYFDVLCLKNISNDNKRIPVDWMKFYYPLTGLIRNNRILSYEEWDEELIIQGGIFIVKQNLIKNFYLDERLHLGELEDMQFSKQAFLNGLLISFDPNNYFISRIVRHKAEDKNNFYFKYGVYYHWLKALVKNYFRFKNVIKQYYNKKSNNG